MSPLSPRSRSPPAPDTRLPFKGCLAFDRNAQEYIPFPTETDAMLASLMLAYRLASPVLSVVLALVRHPNFNTADITLSKPEDVWARVSEHAAAKPLKKMTCFRRPFPRVILYEVVDILCEERRKELYVQRDTDGPQMGHIDFGRTDRDLRSMSLVCKEWTQPAQRTLGKILVVQDARLINIKNALKSPLIGPWTTELIIFRHNRQLDDERREELLRYGAAAWSLMGQLTKRTSNVRWFSFCTDWFEIPFFPLAKNFPMLPLEELRLIQAGDVTQLLGAVCIQLKSMPRLKHLYLQWSGFGSAYTSFVPESQLEDDTPGPGLEKVTLKIGSASVLSLRYITWITRPRRGENGFRLKSLALDLSGCYYSEDACIRALEPCFSALSELWVNAAGLSEGQLSRMFGLCKSLKCLTVDIRHAFMHAYFDLPTTLERLCINLQFDAPDWESWDDRMTLFLNTRCPRGLRSVSMQFVCSSGAIDVRDAFARSRLLAKERGIDVDVRLGYLSSSGPCMCASPSTT